jgi:hypothetical protein
MLGKLLKYEIKATGRTLVLLYVALLILSVINKIFIGGEFSSQSSDFLYGIPKMVTMVIYVCIMIAIFVVTFFVIIQRFYKNILGDEGYLMNTLPVSAWQNIVSKLLIGMLWSIVSFIIAVISIFIMGFTLDDISKGIELIKEGYTIAAPYCNGKLHLLIVEFIIICFIQLAANTLKIYASISIGHLFNQRRILSSFAAFLIITVMENMLSTIIMIPFMPKVERIGQVIENSIGNISVFTQNVVPMIHGLFIFSIILDIVLFIIFFVITNYILNKKLNLE